MTDRLSVVQLLEVMHAARSSWEALLAEAGEARLTEPGVEGDWSLKDIIAHLTYFETWAANCLMAIQRGEPLPPPEYPGLSVDEENALIYERRRSWPLADVLRDSQVSFHRSIASVQGLPEKDLYDVEFARAAGVAGTIFDLVEGDMFGHYHDHIRAVRAWLDRAGEPSGAGKAAS
jgi:hypothetical protein